MTELTQYVYAFDKANEPIARAKDGDEFSFRTLDCYSGQVCTEEDIVGESFNFSRTNPATGPLYVEGAMPGDVLVVDVLSVEVADIRAPSPPSRTSVRCMTGAWTVPASFP